MIQKEVLTEATRYAAANGFRCCSLPSILNALGEHRKHRFTAEESNNIENLFSRGLPIAVVEHIVENSNRAVHQRLEECFNKKVVLQTLSRPNHSYQMDRRVMPTGKDVVEEAMITRLDTLLPHAKYWHEAVALECMPFNAPHAVRQMSLFVDTTCYYVERMESLANVVASGNLLLQSNFNVSLFATTRNQSNINYATSNKTDIDKFWDALITGIPLSTGPFSQNGWLGYDWYIKRAKVGMVYNLAMLSFMGEKNTHIFDTKAMVKKITESLF